MRFLISAGEASGEYYGAGIINALRQRVPDAEFFGVGGQRMRDAGFKTIVDAHDVSVVGLVEVVKHLPMLRREFKRLVREVAAQKPDVAILIDFPDFNLRLAKALFKLKIPVVYYVSPQLWAWRQSRIKQVRKYVNKMLVIFPFEEEFYRKRGIQAEYVGHPMADEPMPTITREQFATEHKLNPDKTWVALLPGSRRKEVELNLPGVLDSASEIRSINDEFILPVASTLEIEWMRARTANGGVPVKLIRDVRGALFHSRAAIVASGTATVEAALIGTPFVMVYRVAPLTYRLGRRFVKVRRFAMVNLIASKDVVPEFVQNDFIPRAVAHKTRELMTEGRERLRMIEQFDVIRQKLHPPAEGTAADRAAEAILSVTTKSPVPQLK